MRTHMLLGPLPLLLLLSACPAKVQPDAASGTTTAATQVSEEDQRVVRDDGDLYPSDSAPKPPPGSPAPGSGRPDESNGVCRLYAPKLPEPGCCPFETGFDAEAIRKLCGHELYLGESLQHSCGYFYMNKVEGGEVVSLRGSKIIATSTATAAHDHDERIQVRLSKPEFASTPVPGLADAYWSSLDGIHWAFVPGWKSVRLISWADGACPDEAMPAVLKLISEAKEPPADAERPGLIPVARKE
ncbi:MAG: hypothetical protein KC431_30250 [Myxococcales bacterium]|nr:hypothetical protein [Myxococcales bacterium]